MGRRGRPSFWYISPLCFLPSKCSGKEKFSFEGAAPLHLATLSPSDGKAVLHESNACARSEQGVGSWCIQRLSLEVGVRLGAACRRPPTGDLAAPGHHWRPTGDLLATFLWRPGDPGLKMMRSLFLKGRTLGPSNKLCERMDDCYDVAMLSWAQSWLNLVRWPQAPHNFL